MQQAPAININVLLETVNACIQALAEQPFKVSAQHIQLLQKRAQDAINAYEEAQRAAAEAAKQPETPPQPPAGDAQ